MNLAQRYLRRSFYRREASEQREISLANLLRFLRDFVHPYHPYLRKRYREAGIDVERLRTYEDFSRLPVLSKTDYRADPRSFILQPKFPTRQHLVPYDTATIGKKFLLKYVWQAIRNRPYDYAHLYRKMPFKEGKVGRRAAYEWMPVHYQGSAGTTGDPTPVVYTRYELENNLRELASACYLQPDVLDPDRPHVLWNTRGMSLLPGVPHLGFFQGVFTKMLGGLSLFDTCGGKVIPTEKQIEIFAQGKFETLGAVPSYLIHWLRKAVEMVKAGRVPPLSSLFTAVGGAEPVTPLIRKHLKDLAREAGAHPHFIVVSAYGMTEMKWAFTECDEDRGIHLNPKYYFWELLDKDTLKPVEPGQPGVLVFSHIDWRGSVLVRYNTGDLIQGGMQWDRCPKCGYTFPRIYGPISRAIRDFTKIKGTRVPLLDLQNSVRETAGVRCFQVILDKEVPNDELSRDLVRIRVGTVNGCDRQALAESIKSNVHRVNGFTPDEIIFEENPEAFEQELFAKTGVKAEYVVERRPVHL